MTKNIGQLSQKERIAYVDSILDNPELIEEIAYFLYEDIDINDIGKIAIRSRKTKKEYNLTNEDLSIILDNVEQNTLNRIFGIAKNRTTVLLQKKSEVAQKGDKGVLHKLPYQEVRERSIFIEGGLKKYKDQLRDFPGDSEKYLQIFSWMIDFLSKNAEQTTFIDWWIAFEKIPSPLPEKLYRTYFPLRKIILKHLCLQFNTVSDCEALLSIRRLLSEEDIARVYATRDRLFTSGQS